MAIPANYASIKSGLTSLQLWRKLTIVIVVAMGLAALPFIHTFGPMDGAYHESVEVFGYVLIAICILGRAWCVMYIGGRKAKELVTEGPYSISRNPLYMFSFFGAAGLGAQTGSLVVAVIFVVAAVLIFRPVVKREEAALVQIFGEPFTAYCKRVPRFGPYLPTWHDVPTVEVRLRLVYKTLADSLVFVALIPLFELIDLAQEAGYLTVLLRLP